MQGFRIARLRGASSREWSSLENLKEKFSYYCPRLAKKFRAAFVLMVIVYLTAIQF